MKDALRNARIVRAAAWRLRVLDSRVFGRARKPRVSGPGGRSASRGVYADDLAMTRAEWRDQGATPGLVDRARSASQNSVAWTVLPPRLWLVFCGALLDAGDEEAAERILRTWLGRQAGSLELLATCLPVARFARDLGVRSKVVESAAGVADVLAANRDADVLRALVAGRSVAVVGNGPGGLGAGRGAEIDAHDVVVRFNNYPQGYDADYGSRTDVWVRGAHRDVRDRPDIGNLSLVVWEMDFFRNLLEVPAHADVLVRDTRFYPEKVTHIDTATKLGLRQASGLLLPTSGAQLLWLLDRARGSLRGVDVYGFSTLDGSGELGHYFDGLGDMGSRHDTSGEGAFLRALLADDGAGSAAAVSAARRAWVELSNRANAAEPEDDLAARRAVRRDGSVPVGEPVGEVTVVSCAYREYDPARGKTGGPAGVLATQQLALGDVHRGQRLEYRFEEGTRGELRAALAVQIAGLSGKVSDIVVGGEFVRTDPAILEALASGRKLLLVCHELGTAYGAYLLGVPYVLVYHQQGSTVQEIRSLGRRPTAHEASVADRLERLVLENAQRVFFPSLGARETYRATARLDGAGEIAYSDRALYNTVSAVDHDAAGADGGRAGLRAEVARELRIPARDGATDLFVSVGDFNDDKGLDQVPVLLERYTRLTGRKVVWVAVGASSDGGTFAALQERSKRWSFTARLVGERMTHGKLLALLDLADYYVMLHRNSIFDLATLEAMRAGKALVLSPVGGNTEVDLDGNVLFVTDDTIDDACRVIETRDPVEWGERNRRVFEEHFSLDRFAARYREMLDEQLAVLLAEPEPEPEAEAEAEAEGAPVPAGTKRAS